MQYGLGLICNRSIHAMGIWWRLLMGHCCLDFTCRDSRIDPYVYPYTLWASEASAPLFSLLEFPKVLFTLWTPILFQKLKFSQFCIQNNFDFSRQKYVTLLEFLRIHALDTYFFIIEISEIRFVIIFQFQFYI